MKRFSKRSVTWLPAPGRLCCVCCPKSQEQSCFYCVALSCPPAPTVDASCAPKGKQSTEEHICLFNPEAVHATSHISLGRTRLLMCVQE